jgi:hypothetical protein
MYAMPPFKIPKILELCSREHKPKHVAPHLQSLRDGKQ